MSTVTANQYELGPEQQIEAKVSAVFARLSPFRRPREPEALAYWLGQIVGWPGHDFFSGVRSLVDQENYVAALIREISQSASEIMRVTGQNGTAGNLWSLLCDRVAEDEAAASEVYLEQLGTLLPKVVAPPCFYLAGQALKISRPERDLFAMVPIRVVCAYLMHVEGRTPPARGLKKTQKKLLTEAEPAAEGARKPERPTPFPREHAANLAQTVLSALNIGIVADIESLVRRALAEPWAAAETKFCWWYLLPDVAYEIKE